MSWRTVVISTRSKLDYKLGYMVIRGDATNRVYLDEIAILIIENPAVSFTGCLIEALINKKIKVIFCDSKRNPCSELVPYYGSHDDSRKIRNQICWDEGIKQEIWAAIIKEKIRNQASILEDYSHERETEMLFQYASEVLPGDATNREGHAAKVYFNALFGMDFSRQRTCPINTALNYGYGILLSAVNREISINGNITQLGIFHNNVFNHFNLGSDLVEPFRTLVDRKVLKMLSSGDLCDDFTVENKRAIISVLSDEVKICGSNQTVLNSIKIYVKSVLNALNESDVSYIAFARW